MKQTIAFILLAWTVAVVFLVIKALSNSQWPDNPTSTVVKTTPQAEWYTENDPVTQFVSAASNDGANYAITGTETWTLCHSTGLKPNKVTSGPKVYLCPTNANAAIELELPKVNGTNQYFRNATSPCFTSKGDRLIATLHYQCGDVAKLFVTAWDVKTRVPQILFKCQADLCACDISEENLPKSGTLANWYMSATVVPGPKPVVVPHSIIIGNHKWNYGLE